MRYSKIRIGLVFTAYTLIFSLLLFPALPTATAGLGVAGAIIERDIAPGESFTHEVTVSADNTGDPIDIVVDILGLNQSLEGENIELSADEDSNPYSARTFLEASPSKFHLEPGKSQKVPVKGTVPLSATPGGRYALINIHSLPIGNGTIGIVVAIDIPVRLTIRGSELTRTGMIKSLELEEPISPRQQNFSLILENTGNCHYKARVDAVMKDKDGNVIANTSTPLSSNIIPDAFRIFKNSFVLENSLRPGAYCVNATVKREDGSILAVKEMQFKL